MSAYYGDLTHTNLPDNVDAITSFQDVSTTTKPYVDQYLQYVSAGDTTNAAAIIANHPEIKDCLINAERLNKLRDALLALERMFVSDIESYVINVVNDMGEWDATVAYKRNDIVTYEVEGAKELYRCIGDSEDPSVITIPVGTLPTDTRYWSPLTIRGEQGVSGSGLSPRGAWNSTITYGVDDMVVYNDAWWVANETNIGEEPTDSSTVWTRYFEYRQQISTASSQPSTQLAGEMWFQKQSNGLWKELVKTAAGYDSLITRNAIAVTVSADSWGTEAPYSFSVATAGVKAASGGIVYLSPSATAEQRTAVENAKITAGTKTSDGIPLYAYGEKPTVDIPLIFEIHNDYSYFLTALPGGSGGKAYVQAISESDWSSDKTITIPTTTHKKGTDFNINVYCVDPDDSTKYFTTYGTITTFDWKATVDASGNVTLTTTSAFSGKVVIS